MTRRELLMGFAAAAGSGCAPKAPSEGGGRPELRWGVQSGEVTSGSGLVWCRSDRPARMIVECVGRRSLGPTVGADTDFTAKLPLVGLPPRTRIPYRVAFEAEKLSDWIEGSFVTAPAENDTSDVVFAWSGDTNGQGWGIDDARGGMPAYAALLARRPEFFLHCGDQIYADNPIPASIGDWKNLVADGKDHVAETLDDFRGAFRYARASKEVRALSAAVPLFSVWDDHEVQNDWWPGQTPRIDMHMAYARRAMFEHTPTLRDPTGPMYRSFRWGAHLEVFMLDGRSYRTSNTPIADPAHFLGDVQLAWLAEGLARSTATWKVVACDMPIGLVVSQNGIVDGLANGEDGLPGARELEFARLFSTLKARGVKNVVWLTADVHYAAVHEYAPERAAFKDFDPFSEFVAGPMHAGSFPRKKLDDTFGIDVVWASDAPGSPATGDQFFGIVRIDGKTKAMTVTLVDSRNRDRNVSFVRPQS